MGRKRNEMAAATETAPVQEIDLDSPEQPLPLATTGEPIPTQAAPETNGTPAAPKPAEPKDVKFRRLVNFRMPRVLKALTAIQNLSNKSQYEYTAEQADKIIATLEEKVKTIKVQLKGGTVKAEGWTL